MVSLGGKELTSSPRKATSASYDVAAAITVLGAGGGPRGGRARGKEPTTDEATGNDVDGAAPNHQLKKQISKGVQVLTHPVEFFLSKCSKVQYIHVYT